MTRYDDTDMTSFENVVAMIRGMEYLAMSGAAEGEDAEAKLVPGIQFILRVLDDLSDPPRTETSVVDVTMPDEHGSAYMSFANIRPGDVARTVSVDANIDLDEHGALLGIELLNCPNFDMWDGGQDE